MAASLADLRSRRPGVLTHDCPTRTVLDHVMSRWGVLVLCSLAGGTLRWGALRREVDGISEKMLAQTLKVLVADGLVGRTAFPTVPPHVEYRLTALGRDLVDRMMPLLEWVAEHGEEIVGA